LAFLIVNFSGLSDENLAGRIIRLPLRLIPPQARMPILQGVLRGKKWIAGAGNHGYWLGSYELEKIRLFESIVPEGAIVFDIGAHAGFYTLLASVLVGPRGRVFAFEPDHRNVWYLEEHLRLNAVSNARVIQAAVTDSEGIAWLEEGPNTSTGHLAPVGQFQVKTVTLDGLVSTGQLPTPDYLKIDVEGAEMLVLKGAQNVLANERPTLFLATHGGLAREACGEFLNALGYELRPIGKASLEKTDEFLAFRGGSV
jgi:FkbM family methyltransferase